MKLDPNCFSSDQYNIIVICNVVNNRELRVNEYQLILPLVFFKSYEVLMQKFLAVTHDVLLDSSLNSNEKLILADVRNSLDYYIRINKEFTPSLNVLSKRVGMNIYTVEETLTSLNEKGLINMHMDDNGIRHITE